MMARDPSTIASDPQVSAWVAAHAGAGKTYTLANRVARLLLAGAPPQRILCLTFTKAAAAEMQDRLFRQLGEWAMLPDDDLRARIIGIGGEAHTALPAARRLFAAALETPGGLKVLTIHAFCQIVLSRFPLEAGIPPAFEVLDEQSAREMIADARQHMLERAGSGDADLADAVALLVTETGEFRLTQILDAALGGDRRKLDRFFATLEDDLAARVRAAHGLEGHESTRHVTADFCAALDLVMLEAARAWLAGGSANDLKLSAAIAGALAAGGEEARFALLQAGLLTRDGEPRKTIATKKLAAARPDLLAHLAALQERFCGVRDRHRAARAADLAIAALTAIAAVRDDYARAKRRRGVLDYDDLILQTRDLLDKRGAAAWVLYKLDGGIDHVLIDEAQDTSPEQWDIVRKLTEEFFAGTGRGHAIRTVFAVGDEKQSIFSFQGADPSQFERNRDHFAQAAAGANHPFIDQPLITSRRSAPEILSFVDTVFADEEARAGLTFSGAAITHRAHRETAKGGIEFWPAIAPEPQEETDIYLPVDAVQASSPVARLAAQVAGNIEGWLARRARLPGHEAPIRPRDIMILLPRRDPFGSEVIRQLKARGVPVAGADRVRLTEQIAVMDLIALGRFVLQREDELNLAALLRSPLCGMGEDELYDLAQGRHTDLWSRLVAAKARFASCHAFLSAMLERADYAPPFEFYAHALTALGGRDRLLARLGPESGDAIDEFLSLTLAHEKTHSPSLEAFLDWVERGGTEIKRDMERGRDEVRVMTVHGAKGLEADIVILPDTTAQASGLNRHEGLLFESGRVLFPLPKDQAPEVVQRAKDAADAEALKEHRRLLYVALTRARDRLYVCGFQGKKGVNAQSWYTLTERAARQLGVPVTRGDGEILTYGTLAEEDGDAATAPPAPCALPGWATAPAPREPVTPNPIRPSDIAGGEPGAFSPLAGGAARFLRGNVVHALLARLPEIAPERRRDIAIAFARGQGISDAQAVAGETLAVLDDPRFAAVFGPASRAEVALHARRPDLGLKAPIVGRLDRLAVTETEVLVVDFKTNRRMPETEAGVPALYLDQMALYRAGVEAVFPGRRVVCGLVFTDGPRLLQLSDVVLDARIAGILARLDPYLDPEGVRS